MQLSHVGKEIEVNPAMAILRGASIHWRESKMANVLDVVCRNLSTARIQVERSCGPLFRHVGLPEILIDHLDLGDFRFRKIDISHMIDTIYLHTGHDLRFPCTLFTHPLSTSLDCFLVCFRS